jgi:cytochrome P450
MTSTITAEEASLPKASLSDTLGIIADVIVPTLSKGVIIRRPRVVGLAESLNLDQRAVRRLQRVRAKYGTGPLLLAIPLRSQAVILEPEHVHRVLDGSPEPFSPATSEKRSALSHFEPDVSLITPGPERAERRRFNDEVLDSGRPVHGMADDFLAVLEEEAERILAQVRATRELTWDGFIDPWFRMVRRVVLGQAAADDRELTDILVRLRQAANWAFLRPKRKGLREQFHERVNGYLARAEEGSLAAAIAAMPKSAATAPSDQVAQWLFAFDPAGMATFRALALLASHPDHAERARQETREFGPKRCRNLPYLRACLRESLRLWPTTPAILRQSTQETRWETGSMPKGTGILIFAPYFHRDDERLPYAHRFAPELWLDERVRGGWPLVPFSAGPAICPAQHLVPMLGSAMLAALLSEGDWRLDRPKRLAPGNPLPGTLDNYSLRFILSP